MKIGTCSPFVGLIALTFEFSASFAGLVVPFGSAFDVRLLLDCADICGDFFFIGNMRLKFLYHLMPGASNDIRQISKKRIDAGGEDADLSSSGLSPLPDAPFIVSTRVMANSSSAPSLRTDPIALLSLYFFQIIELAGLQAFEPDVEFGAGHFLESHFCEREARPRRISASGATGSRASSCSSKSNAVVRAMRFSSLCAAKYSPRTGPPSARMKRRFL